MIEGIFSHRYGIERRLFIVMNVADGVFQHHGVVAALQDEGADRDPILKCQIFTMKGDRIVVGVPTLTSATMWIVPAREEGLFWYIDEDIYFM
jgi:hypothetical protein